MAEKNENENDQPAVIIHYFLKFYRTIFTLLLVVWYTSILLAYKSAQIEKNCGLFLCHVEIKAICLCFAKNKLV